MSKGVGVGYQGGARPGEHPGVRQECQLSKCSGQAETIPRARFNQGEPVCKPRSGNICDKVGSSSMIYRRVQLMALTVPKPAPTFSANSVKQAFCWVSFTSLQLYSSSPCSRLVLLGDWNCTLTPLASNCFNASWMYLGYCPQPLGHHLFTGLKSLKQPPAGPHAVGD